MKKHLINIRWNPYYQPSINSWEYTFRPVYEFTGYVTSTIVDPNKLFKKVFGFNCPPSTMTYG